MAPFPAEGNRQWLDALKSLPSAVVVFDRRGIILLANCQASRLFGYADPAELREKSMLDLVVPGERALFQANLGKTFSRGITRQVEYTFVREGQGSFPGGMSTASVQGTGRGEGANIFYVGVLADISNRKETEEALQKSEEKYSLLIHKMLNGFAYHQVLQDERGEPEDYIFLEVNQAFEKLTGLRREDIIGKRVTRVLPGLQVSGFDWIQQYGRVALTGREIRFEHYSEPLGRWYSVLAYSPKQGFFATIFEDISIRKKAEETRQKAHQELEIRVKERTRELADINHALQNQVKERRMAEEALAAEKERLSVTLKSIGDGVIATDVHGKIILGNQAAGVITGWKQEDLAGKMLQDVLRLVLEDKTKSLSPRPLEVLTRRDQEQVNSHLILLDRAGKRRIISQQASPIHDNKGLTRGYVIVFRDITRQKKYEAHLALSQKLESIGQMAAGIAHEINTPMQYIGDNIQFLSDAFQDMGELLDSYKSLKKTLGKDYVDLDLVEAIGKKEEELEIDYIQEEINNAISQALEGIGRVSQLVLAMKDFSHPGLNQKTFTDLKKNIEGTVNISRNEWKYIADMVLELQSDLPRVYCRADEINQVILNMIVNAAQAIKEKVERGDLPRGEIKIIARQAGPGTISITVEDNGPGIPGEIIDYIFDPFFTTKEVGKGTGQGLAIAHDIIVNKHQGKIEVESESGKGSRFVINLPVGDGS